jgi:hypothetical protein
MKLKLEVLKSIFPNSFLDYHKTNLMCKCPWCGVNEFGIELADNHRFNCFRKAKCGETGNIFRLLKKVGRLDLLGNLGVESIKYDERLENIIEKKIEQSLDLTIETVQPPLGWKRIHSDFYLENRGFELFDKFEVGKSKLFRKLKDHVVILVRDGGEIKGYVARIAKDKSELKQLEIDLGHKVPRYQNSQTDFTRLLAGIEEVNENTHTIILVEGLFGKEAVDRHLKLDLNDEVKCCCTFGAKLSPEQIFKLQLKGIKHIILFFDIDVINKIKKYTMEYLNEFESVRVIHTNDKDKDPADLTYKEMITVYNNKIDPIKFFFDKIQVLNLK